MRFDRGWLALAVLLAGCASVPRGPPLLARDEPVEVVAMPVGASIVTVDGKAVAGNAIAGVGVGAGYGALLSLGCGPFAPFCVGPFTALGAGLGGATGTFVTLARSGSGADRAALDVRLKALQALRPLDERLVEAIASEAEGRVRIEPGSPTQLAVRIDFVSLQGTGDGGALLSLGASAWVRRQRDGRVVDEPAESFRLEAPFALQEPRWRTEPDIFERDFRDACRVLARQVVSRVRP